MTQYCVRKICDNRVTYLGDCETTAASRLQPGTVYGKAETADGAKAVAGGRAGVTRKLPQGWQLPQEMAARLANVKRTPAGE